MKPPSRAWAAAVAALLLVGVGMHSYCRRRHRVLRGAEPTPVPRDDPVWQACHKAHVDEVAAGDQEGQEGHHLLFYGDSITEQWLGTDHCQPCPRCTGIADVFHRHYDRYRAGVLAIGGDQTAHLLWRLRNGETPAVHQPKVVVLLIGTNDLGAVAWEAGGPWEAEVALFRAVPGVTLRVLQTLHALRDALPDTHVVLLALLPRGGGPTGYRWPSLFTQPFEVVNAHFRDYTRLDGHLHFLDCGDRFLAPDGRSIRADLMPDALHPNAAGQELLAQCLDPLVHKLMQAPSSAAQGAAPAARAAPVAAQGAASGGGGGGGGGGD